jgi:hypothetical protein
MSRNSTSPVGALHPVLFMLLVYVISIVLAFFVCRVIYFSMHANEGATGVKAEKLEGLTAAK